LSVFTPAELAYLASQRLGRLATIGPDGAPHVVPVGFRYNAETDTIDIGGHGMGSSRKWHDVASEPRVAFVVDDVVPPWRPRLLEIRGVATPLTTGGAAPGRGFDAALIRIAPTRIVSYGVEPDQPHDYRVTGRDVMPGAVADGPEPG
jgi:pyridoxamine 5'-phosphate oxidase family protein